MLRGRQRYKTHAGIPHGSTNALGSGLAFYLQWKTGVAVGQWDDQSVNGNNATQATSGDQAALSGGGLDFEQGEGDHYDFDSQVAISTQEGFVFWLMCNIESTSGNMTVLGLNATTHFLEFQSGTHSIRTRLGSSTVTVTPGDGSRGDFDKESKFLFTLQREAGGTGNINLWKNGVLLPQDEQTANTGDGEFISLGVRNNDRHFDGVMYDVAMVESGAARDIHIERINAHLCAKHGISQTL